MTARTGLVLIMLAIWMTDSFTLLEGGREYTGVAGTQSCQIDMAAEAVMNGIQSAAASSHVSCSGC
ncbi:hypothetical protein [Arthrobacter sp. Z1-15]